MGGFYGLASLLANPASRFNFFRVAAVAVVLGNAAGSLFSFVTLSFQANDLWKTILELAHTTPTDLTLAQAYVNLFSLALLVVDKKLENSQLINTLQAMTAVCLGLHRNAVQWLMSALLVSQAYLLQLGVVVYGGKDLSQEGTPTHPLLALTGPFVPLLPFALAFYQRGYWQQNQYARAVLCGLLLMLELGWFFLLGRRSIFFFFVLMAMGLTFNQPVTRQLLRRNALPILLTVGIAAGLADIYHKLRVLYRFERVQQMQLADALAGIRAADDSRYADIRNRNLALRSSYGPMALGQFVNLFRTSPAAPLGGRQLAGSLLMTAPSDWLIDKRTVLVKEFLYESAYGLGLTDISETLCLESFIDFGWPGFLPYVLLLALLLYPAYAAAKHNPLFALLTGVMLTSLAMSMIETDLITLLASLRWLFIAYILTRLS
ncbi:hypothetical protein AWR27_15330 [Spirosoma montaniterrae]|uniref:Uncharacterized protein n=1 Tax=Spirosoma montaniterrae TaxID=1178516 RepID=A0A1P9WYW6_9BACT|nr:hypothetical protein AWR27_15330 [Spirosoma montaniterrae]